MIKTEAAMLNEATAAAKTATSNNESCPTGDDETLLSTGATDTVDNKKLEKEAEEGKDAELQENTTAKVDESPTNNHNVVADKKEIQNGVPEGGDVNGEQATETVEDDDELNYEITVVSKRPNHTLQHEDDTMSVISSLTFAEATPNHGHQQECTNRRPASTTISVKQQRSKPGTIIKKLLHLDGKRQNNDQNKCHSSDGMDLERGLSKTTVFTTMDDSSSNDSDTPSPSPLEEEVDTSAEQEHQQEYRSPTTSYSEMKGFMIAISIACVGVLLLGLACLLWWTTHSEQHYQVSSSVTDRQDHFIPGSRFRGLIEEEEDVAHEHARFSLAPEVEVLDYMLKAASANKST